DGPDVFVVLGVFSGGRSIGGAGGGGRRAVASGRGRAAHRQWRVAGALDPALHSRTLAGGARDHRPARSLAPDVAWRLVKEIQQAFYLQGRDVTHGSVLAELAEKAGLPRIEFAEAFDSVEQHAATASDFSWVQDLGIAGFPTLLAERNGQLALLTNGYQALDGEPDAATDAPAHVDRLNWAQIRRLALQHKKALWLANGVAVLAVLCSVPIPLLLPLLVDEVLLGKGNSALMFMNQFLPASLHKPVGYIGLMLVATLFLRLGALVFNVRHRRRTPGHRSRHGGQIRRRDAEQVSGRHPDPYRHRGHSDVDALAAGAADFAVQPVGGLRDGQAWQTRQTPQEAGKRQHLPIHPGAYRDARCDPGDPCQQPSGPFPRAARSARAGSARLRGVVAVEERRVGARQRFVVSVRHRHLSRRRHAHGAVFRPVHRPHARRVQLPVVHDRSGRATAQSAVRLLRCGRDERVLDQLDLTINPGEKVAIVGASGGGKSTLVQLLLGLYSADAGVIRFGGASLQDIGLETVRDNVAVVLQHPALFNDTVRANLLMGREQRDDACWQALEIAQLDATIRALPNGLDSVVGRSGVRLSGGQRQRLAIARMVLADPKVVILDEATSALDAATEYNLHQALNRFLSGRTTLIIAHRLSAVKQADRVLVFDGGRIAEDGGHQQLIADGGLYARLYGHLQQRSPSGSRKVAWRGGWVSGSADERDTMKQKRILEKPRLLGIVWPFIAVVLLQALLGCVSLYMMSAVRSYIGGESLWSKGQKDAIYYLNLYANSRDEINYLKYQKAFAIPQGGHDLRLAMDQPVPDIARAKAGILQGGNHPDDAQSIIWLYLNFQHFSYLEQAIDLWKVGDNYLVQLDEVAREMHARIQEGDVTNSDV
nr:hypothetical protein [Tanacetum cinerariifolium]